MAYTALIKSTNCEQIYPCTHSSIYQSPTTLLTKLLLTIGTHLDQSFNLPISTTGLSVALVILLIWWQTNAFRTHLLVLAIVLALLAVAPLLGFSALHTVFLPGHGGYELVLGSFLTIGGLCDHLLLLRSFRQTQQVYQS